MTYSIVARDEQSGEMGIACQSQAFAVGSSVPWALPGIGVVATQSMGEPLYGDLGLENLQAGLTAGEALRALRSVDPHPERRQVAMVDGYGNVAVYTGEACVAAAGHARGSCCAALGNMVASARVWEAMVGAWEGAAGTMAERLVAALHAAEAEGGDVRGRRSAAVTVVRARRTGRPWRDRLVDLRVDDHPDPVGEIDRLVRTSARYHRVVEALDQALDGEAGAAAGDLGELPPPDPAEEPDIAMWTALVGALAGRDAEAAALMSRLREAAPPFATVARRMGDVGLIPEDVVRRLLRGG
ncbi:MAG TPA: DUF1028 domain-containing protein [Miltoncostaeaceae bacterium]|nr:DUF1028 domain-containing protein [Miltoncostaeaceae bacterium]